jgi:hypothetical protein
VHRHGVDSQCAYFLRGRQVNMMFDAHSARVARWEEHGHRLGVRLVKATTHREAQALMVETLPFNLSSTRRSAGLRERLQACSCTCSFAPCSRAHLTVASACT